MVYERLQEGAENARTGRELCRELNITPRKLMSVVERERRAGHAICASTGRGNTRPGYYIAANKAEMQRYCKRLWKRAGELHKTRRACLETIERLPPEEREAG